MGTLIDDGSPMSHAGTSFFWHDVQECVGMQAPAADELEAQSWRQAI